MSVEFDVVVTKRLQFVSHRCVCMLQCLELLLLLCRSLAMDCAHLSQHLELLLVLRIGLPMDRVPLVKCVEVLLVLCIDSSIGDVLLLQRIG